MPVSPFYRLTMGMWAVFAWWTGWWAQGVDVAWFAAGWWVVAVVCSMAAIIGRDLCVRIGLGVLDVMLAVAAFVVVTDAEPFSGQYLVAGLLAVNFVQVAGMLFSPMREASWIQH